MNNTELELFPIRESFNPQIYAYYDTNPNHKGLLKIGYTSTNVEERVAQQFPVLQPEEKPYTIIFSKSSMREDGTSFTDKDIHKEDRNLIMKEVHNRCDNYCERICNTIDEILVNKLSYRKE